MTGHVSQTKRLLLFDDMPFALYMPYRGFHVSGFGIPNVPTFSVTGEGDR